MSQAIVEKQLKSPSTAEFPHAFEEGVSIHYQGECRHKISGYVAQAHRRREMTPSDWEFLELIVWFIFACAIGGAILGLCCRISDNIKRRAEEEDQ